MISVKINQRCPSVLMKLRLFFLQTAFFAALFFFCAAIMPADEGGSSVWKISKDGKTLFLGGSVHVLREKDFPLPQEFDQAFERADILVLEANVEQASDFEAQAEFMSKLILRDGKTFMSCCGQSARNSGFL